MSGLDASQHRGRQELGHDAQRAAGNYGAQRRAGIDPAANAQDGDLAQAAGDGRHNSPAGHFEAHALDGSERGRARPFQLTGLAAQACDHSLALAFDAALLERQALRGQCQRVAGGATAARIGDGALQIALGHQAIHPQARYPVGLLLGEDSLSLRLAVLRTRLIESRHAAFFFSARGLLLGGQLRAQGVQLRSDCRHAGFFFLDLELLRVSLDLHQRVPGLHFTSESQVALDHAAGNRGLNRVNGLIHFDPAAFAHFVPRHGHDEEPRQPRS